MAYQKGHPQSNTGRTWFKKGIATYRRQKGKVRGYKWSKEAIERRKGEGNPYWKGGKKTSHYKRKIKAEGSHNFGEWELLKKQYGYTCPACKRKEPEIKLTEDHIIPLTQGGSDNIENIQPLCHSCNSKKHTKIKRFDCPNVKDFRKKL